MHQRFPFLLLVVSLVCHSDIRAQDYHSQVSVNVSGLQKLQPSLTSHDVLPYFEVEASTRVAALDSTVVSLHGAIHLGTWSDKYNQFTDPIGCKDCLAYSFRALSIGYRWYFRLERLVVPIEPMLGLTHHTVFAKYERGTSLTGSGSDHRLGFNVFEFGARARLLVRDRISLRAHWLRLVKIPQLEDTPLKTGSQIGVSIAYLF